MEKPYYLAYENRYKKIFEAGADHWGHTPDDEILYATLEKWVYKNNLFGKRIIEFACGEGACGVILSKLGCYYHGVDIAPSAVNKSREAIKSFPNARVDVLDMVKGTTGQKYDAALDCMGFHMLITDNDRKAYLQNAFSSLKSFGPMLFFRESYKNDNNRETVFKGEVESYQQWKEITGNDYDTPTLRRVDIGHKNVEVLVPLVPARANDKEGYIAELQSAGFIIEDFVEMDISSAIKHSASIYVRKP